MVRVLGQQFVVVVGKDYWKFRQVVVDGMGQIQVVYVRYYYVVEYYIEVGGILFEFCQGFVCIVCKYYVVIEFVQGVDGKFGYIDVVFYYQYVDIVIMLQFWQCCWLFCYFFCLCQWQVQGEVGIGVCLVLYVYFVF